MILDELYESPQSCPECGGPAFNDLLLAEKKDACYHKVRSRYKVWPSAYASGALVQCRKKGAANWGNKSKNEDVEEGLNEFAPDGFNGGDGDEFSPEIAKMAYEDGFTKGVSLADGATLERAITINYWHSQHGGMYKQYFAKGFKTGRMNKIRHDNKQYNLNLKLMKDGSIRRGEQDVAEGQLDEKCWDTHRQAGMKRKGDRMVPNCVPKEGVEEAQYDRGDYYDAHTAGEYGRDLSHNDDRRGHGASRSTDRDGRDDHFGGQSANLPADPFGRTTGAVPKAGSGRIHNIALPGEIDEGDKIGNMDADQFDTAMSRLKKLAGQGPMKTVWDPVKRVYKNVPVAVQPKQQPGK